MQGTSEKAAATTAWSGSLAATDGALCYLGGLSDARGHHHAATQLVRAWSGYFELADAQGRRAVGSAAIIPSGRQHSIRIVEPTAGFLLFVDPRTVIGGQIDARVDNCDDPRAWVTAGRALQNWAEPEPPDAARLLDELLAALCAASSSSGTNTWHPSVRAAVDLIPQILPGPVSLSAVAKQVALSPSRLSRLFNDQVGQSFPTYVRWVRLRRAIDALRDGASLTGAAHLAGFTDSAHANRVCHEMFGLSPSQASRQLVWG